MAAVLVTWCGKAGAIKLCTIYVVIEGGRLLGSHTLRVAAVLVTRCGKAGPIELCASHVVIRPAAYTIVTPDGPACSLLRVTMVTSTEQLVILDWAGLLMVTQVMNTAQLAALGVHSVLRQGLCHLHQGCPSQGCCIRLC